MEALFVGRHDIMEDVLSRVTASIQSSEKHYILLVGPRGSGKTHFLALAYYLLMDRLHEANAGHRVAVALLKEEEWGVASYVDLVVRILRALADQAPELESEIAEIFDRFSKDSADAETFAIALLRRHVRGKTLLLVCENLVDLFHGLEEEGQKRWRATIQEDANWTILASTPSLFTAVKMQEYPFYGFFTIRALEKIDLDTGIELLARKAVHEDKIELAELLRTPLGRARARAIHHLAAGNHRAYVVLFDFLDKESLKDLIDPFMHMVDDLTPYYQDRMRQLPPAQRKIVEFLCLEVKPTTVKDIAIPCLMSQQTAAKQIGELETAGFVRRIRSGRNTFCELSEPLMRICIEVKDNNTQHFRLFVEFLRHWFTTRELERRHAAFEHGERPADLDRLHVEEAVKCSHTDRREPFVDALHVEAQRCLDVGDYKGLATIQETLVQDRGNAKDYCRWVYALARAGDGQSAITVGQEAAVKYPDNATLQHDLALAYFTENQFADALSAIDRAIAFDGDKPAYLCIRADILLRLKRFEEAIQDAQSVLDTDADHWHSLKQIINALVPLGRLEEADARARELLHLAPDKPSALTTAARFYLSQDRLDDALELVDKVLNIDPNDRPAHRLRGTILFEMEDYLRASEELQKVASHHPQSVPTHCRLADSLLLSGDWEAAIKAAEHLIEIDPEHLHAHYVRGLALIELGQTADAIAALDKLLPSDHCDSLLVVASEVRRIGDHASARRYLDRVMELQPDNRELWIERTRLYIAEAAFDAAATSATKIEALPGDSLLGRLVAAQAAAATKPLEVPLNTLGAFVNTEEFETNELENIEAITGILTVSVRNFGPRYLPQGLAKLRKLFTDRLHDGVVGEILTDFLIENVHDGFVGSLADWDEVLNGLTSSLNDLPDCRIPIEMLRAAVRHAKTGDDRHLLSLPLEQRQLLEEVLPPPPM